jgi:hypothetical protein
MLVERRGSASAAVIEMMRELRYGLHGFPHGGARAQDCRCGMGTAGRRAQALEARPDRDKLIPRCDTWQVPTSSCRITPGLAGSAGWTFPMSVFGYVPTPGATATCWCWTMRHSPRRLIRMFFSSARTELPCQGVTNGGRSPDTRVSISTTAIVPVRKVRLRMTDAQEEGDGVSEVCRHDDLHSRVQCRRGAGPACADSGGTRSSDFRGQYRSAGPESPCRCRGAGLFSDRIARSVRADVACRSRASADCP